MIKNSKLNPECDHRTLRTEKPQNDLIYLKETVTLTGCTRKTIYEKVCRREMPVVSVVPRLKFSRKQLKDWIERGCPTVPEMIAQDYLNYTKTEK